MERRWWWQRIHPALRVLLFVVYFGAAIAGIAVALVQGTSLSGSAPIAATTTVSADNATATAPGVTETTATPETTATTTPQTSAPAPASGRDLYSAHCASCHGADLQGGIGPELDVLGRQVGDSRLIGG